ncbi:MAG: hypothetical protein GX624_03565 [Actinobacteria bacterium]|nr:hypothetical protein [Actinomycetota bacterium]
MISEELAFVALAGESVPYSHAVLIETPQGWHLELEDVPADSCPFLEGECEVTFDTWEGDRYSGSVTASYKSEDPIYLVLTGLGELKKSSMSGKT